MSKATRQGRATPRCDATTRSPEGWGGPAVAGLLRCNSRRRQAPPPKRLWRSREDTVAPKGALASRPGESPVETRRRGGSGYGASATSTYLVGYAIVVAPCIRSHVVDSPWRSAPNARSPVIRIGS